MTFRAATVASFASGASNTVAVPTGTVSGDGVVGFMSADTTSITTFSISGGSAWSSLTKQEVTVGDTQTAGLFYKSAGGAEPANYTCANSASGAISIIIASYSNVDAAVLDGAVGTATSINNPNLATPPSSPVSITANAVTTATANADVIACYTVDWNASTVASFTDPAGTNRRGVSTPSRFCNALMVDFTQVSPGSTGSVVATGTRAGNTGNSVAFMLALKPAAGGGAAADESIVNYPLDMLLPVEEVSAADPGLIFFNQPSDLNFYATTLQSSIAGAAGVVRQGQAIRSAAQAQSAAVARSVGAVRSVAQASSAAVGRTVQAVRLVAQSSAATLLAIKTKLLTLSASVGSAATIVKLVAAARSASSIVVPSVVRLSSAVRSSTVGQAASVIRMRALTLAAAIGESASLKRVISAARAASTSGGASAARAIAAVRSAAGSQAASVTRAPKLIRSAVAASGASMTTLKAKLLTLAASVGSSATVAKAASAVRAIASPVAASIARGVSIVRSVAQGSAATRMALKLKFLTLAAAVGSAASLNKAVKIVRGVSAQLQPSLAKQTGRVVSAAQPLLAALVQGRRDHQRRATSSAGDRLRDGMRCARSWWPRACASSWPATSRR
jgi:hypothetical protein